MGVIQNRSAAAMSTVNRLTHNDSAVMRNVAVRSPDPAGIIRPPAKIPLLLETASGRLLGGSKAEKRGRPKTHFRRRSIDTAAS